MPDERFEPCVNGFFAIFNTKLFISYNDYNLQEFFYSSKVLNYDNILANHSEADKNNTLPKGDLEIYY